uniref:Transmembrane emp24 domain-containing protein 1-like n=1 Tax=Hirondellea gigas TaxID=1518452 RepID=A0A2P2I1J9_9CRUS
MHISKSILLLVMLTVCSKSIAEEKEYTIIIKPRAIECYYIDVKAGHELEIEYQVINGDHGELDVDFILYGLKNVILKYDKKQSDAIHRLTMTQGGEYKFCWDNTFSRFSRKTIFFTYYISNPNSGEDDDDPWNRQNIWINDEEIYEMTVSDIRNAVDRIKSYLTKARLTQDILSAHEAKDRNVAENNYSRINMFSCISVAVMLITGAVQVLLLRSLFDDKSKLHKIWGKSNPVNSPRY